MKRTKKMNILDKIMHNLKKDSQLEAQLIYLMPLYKSNIRGR
jgi:hypothetical protein